MNDLGLDTLDFLYAPSTDVAADTTWFSDVLGAEVVFAIESGGTRVAMLRLGAGTPSVLVTDHLPDERPILLYRVASLAETARRLRARGWTPDRTVDLPMGAASTFHAPGGLRLAVYEPARPFVVESMSGRRDF
jgi:hypothetical protein